MEITIDTNKAKDITEYIQLLEGAIDFEHKAKRIRENRLFCKWIAKYLSGLPSKAASDLKKILMGKNPFTKDNNGL